MEFFDVVRKRYSYRGRYAEAPVPDEHLRQIVHAGIHAPSGCNLQTTEFVIVNEPDKVRTIADIVGRADMASAPAVIVVLCNTTLNFKGMSFWVEDCAAAVENMLLAVTALGYASCWIDGALRREGRAKRIAELLGVPAERQVRVVLPVGVAAEESPRKEKKPFEQRAWFNSYGS